MYSSNCTNQFDVPGRACCSSSQWVLHYLLRFRIRASKGCLQWLRTSIFCLAVSCQIKKRSTISCCLASVCCICKQRATSHPNRSPQDLQEDRGRHGWLSPARWCCPSSAWRKNNSERTNGEQTLVASAFMVCSARIVRNRTCLCVMLATESHWNSICTSGVCVDCRLMFKCMRLMAEAAFCLWGIPCKMRDTLPTWRQARYPKFSPEDKPDTLYEMANSETRVHIKKIPL